jgi:hypothetical protein
MSMVFQQAINEARRIYKMRNKQMHLVQSSMFYTWI